jgi:flagellar basal-body rod modification protein FlgD
MELSALQTIDAQAAAASTATSASASGGSNLGKADFLKLLVSQLQNQDPTNPLDDKQFIAQLAQFSSLEQAMETNTKLTALQDAQSAAVNAQMAGLVGKHVVASSNIIGLATTGDVPPIAMSLSGAAGDVQIKISDSQGTIVRSIDAGQLATGAQSVAWDGCDDSGKRLPTGQYNVQIKATDSSGAAVGVLNEIEGTVGGVAFENGVTELLIGTLRVKPADVLRITGS